MRRAAGARRGETVFARVGLDELDQLLDVLGGHRGVDGDHVGRHGDNGDRREVLDGIVGHLGEQARVDKKACAHGDQRVAIPRRRSDHARRDIAARARLVHHVELLAETGRQLVGHDAGDGVSRPAGREAHHHLHRLVGVGLSDGSLGKEKRDEANSDTYQRAQERPPPLQSIFRA